VIFITKATILFPSQLATHAYLFYDEKNHYYPVSFMLFPLRITLQKEETV